MLLKVCRAFRQSPNVVRGWEYVDYLEALDLLTEVPPLDDAVYLGFLKPSGGASGGSKNRVRPLATKEDREKVLASLGQRS